MVIDSFSNENYIDRVIYEIQNNYHKSFNLNQKQNTYRCYIYFESSINNYKYYYIKIVFFPNSNSNETWQTFYF